MNKKKTKYGIVGKGTKFGLMGLGIMLMVGIVTPALADPGIFTGCLSATKGTFYNFQSGTTSTSPCSKSDATVSFYDNVSVNALQARVASDEANITVLQGQVSTLQSNVTTLQGQVATDETNITALQGNVATLQNNVATLQGQVSSFQTLLSGVTRTGNDIHVTGANLHIESGSGRTDGATNGLGNLIIGYNEARPPMGAINNRSGSHNLILGRENNYGSYAGIVVGYFNEISAPFASISGGNDNIASGSASSVSGGAFNTASGDGSSISGGGGIRRFGGTGNTASGDYASVSGGQLNIASGIASSVSGGSSNKATGNYSSVSGGDGSNSKNLILGDFNWAAGTSGTAYSGNFFASS